ncbi:MAG: DUF488 family protein [Bacteroidia bacterium]
MRDAYKKLYLRRKDTSTVSFSGWQRRIEKGGILEETYIYSIGHGRKPIEVLIEELRSFEITYLADVRSIPYSRFNPQYNQHALKQELEKHGITYVYLGDLLGGRPKNEDCYPDGKISYEIIVAKSFFKEGLKRLLTAQQKHIPVAVMCSETKPEECHRSRLIGKELLNLNLSVKHIIGIKELKQQDELVLQDDKPSRKNKG